MSNSASSRAALTAALALAFSVSPRGASPTFWHVATHAEFLKGDAVEHIAVDGQGRLLLAPASDLVYEATTIASVGLMAWRGVDDIKRADT